MALNALRQAPIEAVRRDKGWGTSRLEAALKYKARLGRMGNGGREKGVPMHRKEQQMREKVCQDGNGDEFGFSVIWGKVC